MALALVTIGGALWLGWIAIDLSERGGFALRDWSVAAPKSVRARSIGPLVFRWRVAGRVLTLASLAVAIAGGFLWGRL